MKRQLLREIFIFSYILLSIFLTGVSADCYFPDNQWVVVSPANHINYYADCRWGCDVAWTGKVCETHCAFQFPECDIGHRKTRCTPPHEHECVACHQDANEATEGGYLFEKSRDNAQRYDLMSGFGTFEYAKIYDSQNYRTAVHRVNKSGILPDETKWDDIMFNDETLSFYGAGEIVLFNHETYGAINSNIFAELSAPYARLSVCGLSLAEDGYTPEQRIHGLVYEFHYRQRFEWEDTIQLTMRIMHSNNYLHTTDKIYGSEPIHLPSTEKWKHFQGIVDFDELDQYPPNTACIQLEFQMTQYHEMQLDEIQVFANYLRNSKFEANSDTQAANWQIIGESNLVDVKNSAVVIAPDTGIFQLTQFDYSDNNGDKLEALFSIQVKGTGILNVIYNVKGIAKTLNSIIYTELEEETEWKTLRVPFTVYAHAADELVYPHQFSIKNVATSTGDLTVDNAYVYVDYRRCPVMQCKDAENRVFINGQCELCSASDSAATPCISGMKQTGCMVSQEGIEPNCTQPCTVVGTDGGNDIAQGEWDTGEVQECTWRCNQGFWFSRSGGVSGGSTCNTCTPLQNLRCNVGWYAVMCGAESDAMCLPCSILNRYDSSVVYKAANEYNTLSTYNSIYDTKRYNETEAMQCMHSCGPGQFQYAVRSDNGIPMCFPCSVSVCGASDDGISSLRMIDGMQFTKTCTDTKDSECHICESNDLAVIFSANGKAIGDWCAYQCSAGSKPCGTCQWDPVAAISMESNQTKVPFHQGLMVRFTGKAKINTAEFGAYFSIKVHVSAESSDSITKWEPPGATGVVVRLFPVVPPPSLANMERYGSSMIGDAPEQSFDIIVEARDFINTNNYNIWNDEVVVTGTRLFLVYDIESTKTDLIDFKLQIVNSTNGCCAPRFPNHTEALDPASLTRCIACDLTVTLPTNSHWRDPDDCSWDCDTLFEIIPNGNPSECISCSEPDCSNGTYWTECNTCADCNNLLMNSNFNGPGTTRRDSSSCPVLCNEDFFLFNTFNGSMCAVCTTLAELDCSNVSKKMGNFFESPCSHTEDSACINCLICAPGWNATKECGKDHDTVCSRCDKTLIRMPDTSIDGGAVWRLPDVDESYCQFQCVEGRQYNPIENTCFVCSQECEIGFFPVSCTYENNYMGCDSCLLPENAVILSVGIMDQNRSCMWECGDDHEYNNTVHGCVPQTVTEPLRINVPTPAYCSGTTCGWGFFFDTTFEIDPCSEMCRECPAIPTMDSKTSDAQTVFIRKGSCEWVCLHPYFLSDGICITF